MKLFINTRSGVPIYKQIEQQIEKGIAGGIYEPGDRLPTVREVALDLTVNPNTVARAYRELEYRGIIVSVQGRGTFISSAVKLNTEEKRMMIVDKLRELFREAEQLNISPSMLENIFEAAFRKWQKGGLDD